MQNRENMWFQKFIFFFFSRNYDIGKLWQWFEGIGEK